jgi:hypothetical protein
MTRRIHRPSPAIVVACLALIAALVGNARAVTGGAAREPSTINEYREAFSVAPGQVESDVAYCQRPNEYAISGGFQVVRGNFVYVLTAGTLQSKTGFVVEVLVPNKIAAPGVLPARMSVKVLCAKEGVPIVP